MASPNLTNELKALSDQVTQFRLDFKSFPKDFSDFNKSFQEFLQLFKKNASGGGGGGGGGGSGGGSGGGNAPGGAGGGQGGGNGAQIIASKLGEMSIRFTQELAANVKAMDELQSRAMATNTSLSELDIPAMGVRFSELAEEVLTLREEGFKKVNNSTLSLVSTMKRTNQNTLSLTRFLSKTSLSVGANSNEIQELASKLGDTARIYGMSQEKMYQIANKLSESLKLPSLMGKGKESMQAFSELAAKLGDRATEPLSKVADFLTGVGHETAQMAGGVFDISNRLLSQNATGQRQLTEEAVNKFVSAWRAATRGLGSGNVDRRQIQAIAEQQFGGMANVQAFLEVSRSMSEASQATDKNNQELGGLRDAQEKYADAMERSAKSLEEIVTKLPRGAFQAGGSVAGGVATVLGTVGAGMIIKKAISTIGADMVAGMVGGPVGVAIGAGVGIYSLVAGGMEIWQAVKENTKATADQAKVTNDLLQPDSTEGQKQTGPDLISILNSMAQSLGPDSDTYSKESLALQQQNLEALRELNARFSDQLGKPQPFAVNNP